MRLQGTSLDQVAGVPLIAALFFTFVVTDKSQESQVMILVLLALNVASCRRAPREKVIFIIFNLAFLFFLAGRILVAMLFPKVGAVVHQPVFGLETERLMNVLVFSSILAIRVVFSLSFQYAVKQGPRPRSDVYVAQLRRLSSGLLYAVIVPKVIVIAERIVFVSTYGYESFYVEFTSQLPLVLSRVAALFEPLIFLYLATFPARRATHLHLCIYVIISALSLGYGQRNGLALGLVFALVYLALRDVLTPDPRPWLSKKLMLLAVQLAVPLVVFFAAFTYFRSGIPLPQTPIGVLVASFFASQGSAVFNLGYAIELQDMFPSDKFYSLGPVLGFLKENTLSLLLFGTTALSKASSELAVEGHNFSFALPYLVNPDYYGAGGGYGSNFIAELWIDFGTMGVVVGSAFYGLLMARFVTWLKQRGPIVAAFVFAGALQIIYAPRAQFLGFLLPILSMPTIAVYVTLHMIARRGAKRAAARHQSEPLARLREQDALNRKLPGAETIG